MRCALVLSLLTLGAVAAGCGDDAGDPTRDLRSARLTVVDWGRADPRALCEPEAVARGAAGRFAVRTQDTPAGQQCWIALRKAAPVATGEDVTEVVDGDDGRRELRFTPAAARRLRALGPDAHVGVVSGESLLGVVFPGDGRVRLAPPKG